MTFNVELVNGDLDAGVDKLGEVQKDVREPAFEDSGSGRAEDARQKAAEFRGA